MRRNIKIISTVVSLMLIVTVFAIGCTPSQRPVPEKYGTRYYYDNRYTPRLGGYGYGYRDYYKPDRMYGYYYKDLTREDLTFDNIPTRLDRYGINNTTLRNRLENAVERIARVRDATVIKKGDTCYVGIDATPGTNIENVAALRTEVANKLRQVDPTIKRVYVTLDKDRVSRLRTYARDIDLGRPIRNVLRNIEDLFD